MHLTFLTALLGLLFLLIPIVIAQLLEIRLVPRVSKAALGMVLGMVVIGAVVYFLFQCDNIMLNIVFALLAVVSATLMACIKARLSWRGCFVPVLSGMSVGIVVVGLCVLLILATGQTMLQTRYFVPVFGLMAGSITIPCARALHIYYMGLRRHGRLYNYLVANGASHAEALHYFVRRAVERTLLTGTDRLSANLLALSPFILWTALICGTDVLTAIALQVLLICATFCAMVLSVYVSVRVAQRYGRDAYSRYSKL